MFDFTNSLGHNGKKASQKKGDYTNNKQETGSYHRPNLIWITSQCSHFVIQSSSANFYTVH